MREILVAGTMAFNMGKSISENPHVVHTDAWTLWNTGYENAKTAYLTAMLDHASKSDSTPV